jgi:hypothetical protein
MAASIADSSAAPPLLSFFSLGLGGGGKSPAPVGTAAKDAEPSQLAAAASADPALSRFETLTREYAKQLEAGSLLATNGAQSAAAAITVRPCMRPCAHACILNPHAALT